MNFDKISELIDWCKSQPSGSLISELISICNPMNVWVSFDKKPDSKIERIILSPMDKTSPTPFNNRCNGLVIDCVNWKVLAMHPRNMYIHPSRKDVNKFIRDGKYTIYEINDGTVITLYYWNDSWHFSTVNGFDVTDIKWMGDKTYCQIFNDLIERIIGKNPIEFYATLNKDYNYSIGFRSHEFHPLIQDSEKLWLVQVCNGEDIVDEPVDIGIERQTIVTNPDFTSLDKLEESLSDSLSYKHDDVYLFKYGYILRSKDIEIYDVIIESPLLKNVKYFMYDKLPDVLMKHSSNKNLLNIRIMLSVIRGEKEDFIHLFPQLAAQQKRYDSFVTTLISSVVRQMRNERLIGSSEIGVSEVKFRKLIDEMCNMIKKKHFGFSPFNPSSPSIIHDCICEPLLAAAYVIFCN